MNENGELVLKKRVIEQKNPPWVYKKVHRLMFIQQSYTLCTTKLMVFMMNSVAFNPLLLYCMEAFLTLSPFLQHKRIIFFQL